MSKNENYYASYPLEWPSGVERTTPGKRKNANFKEKTTTGKWKRKSMNTATSDLMNEIDLWGGKNVVLSCNVPHRKDDGMPYAKYKKPEDPGAVIYFQVDDEHWNVPIDTYTRVPDNIYAIYRTLNHLRAIERDGGKTVANRAYTNFKALPEAGAGTGSKWYEILGVDYYASEPEIIKAYRRKAKVYHPDKPNGSREKWNELQEARDQGLAIANSNTKS